MAIPNRQIGWNTDDNLLWEISKQLDKLICVAAGCGPYTTTTTTSITPTTTTTTSYPIPIQCIIYVSANGNIYIYDPLTNTSVEVLGGDTTYYQVANTDTKLWTAAGGGYIQEYDVNFNPGPSLVYNRYFSTDNITVGGTFAINNTTLIAGEDGTQNIYELDITTSVSINTLKGVIEIGYTTRDLLLTTSGKLIIIANDIATSSITKVYQYDYATWTLETDINITGQLPELSYGVGIAQYNSDIYIFTRVIECIPNSTPSGVYLLDPITFNLTLLDDIGLSCQLGASSWLPCNTVNLNSGNSNLLGCVYYTNYFISNKAWLYDVNTDISTMVNLPNDLFGTSMNAHTSTKLWKTNETDTIIEWINTNNTTTLNFNRNITFSGLSPQFYQIICLQAINNTTLLTLRRGVDDYNNPEGTYTYSLARLDITNNIVTASQMTLLFNIYSPGGVQDFLLTLTNKIIVVGKRINSSQLQEIYLSQYSYPDGALEIDINLSTTIPPYTEGIARCKLFQFNGNLFLSVLALNNTSSTIYNVDLNNPQNLIFVRTITNSNQISAWYNSSLNCNTVNLNTITTTTTSTTLAPTGFNTIYTHFEAL